MDEEYDEEEEDSEPKFKCIQESNFQFNKYESVEIICKYLENKLYNLQSIYLNNCKINDINIK